MHDQPYVAAPGFQRDVGRARVALYTHILVLNPGRDCAPACGNDVQACDRDLDVELAHVHVLGQSFNQTYVRDQKLVHAQVLEFVLVVVWTRRVQAIE